MTPEIKELEEWLDSHQPSWGQCSQDEFDFQLDKLKDLRHHYIKNIRPKSNMMQSQTIKENNDAT